MVTILYMLNPNTEYACFCRPTYCHNVVWSKPDIHWLWYDTLREEPGWCSVWGNLLFLRIYCRPTLYLNMPSAWWGTCGYLFGPSGLGSNHPRSRHSTHCTILSLATTTTILCSLVFEQVITPKTTTFSLAGLVNIFGYRRTSVGLLNQAITALQHESNSEFGFIKSCCFQIRNASNEEPLEASLAEIQKLNFLSLHQNDYLSPQYFVNISEVIKSLIHDAKVQYVFQKDFDT